MAHAYGDGRRWSGATNAAVGAVRTLFPMTRRRSLRAAALLAAISLLAACGSTVPLAKRQQAARAASTGDGVEVVAGGDEFAADGTELAAGPAAGGSSGRTGATTRTGASASKTATASASTKVGPGVDADKLRIGLAYAVNAGAANAALGATGITTGDVKAEYQIVIDDINAHGGLSGRKLEPVWHEVDANSTATYDTLEQQACDNWTQDNNVFAATGGGETLLQCLHNRGVVAFSGRPDRVRRREVRAVPVLLRDRQHEPRPHRRGRGNSAQCAGLLHRLEQHDGHGEPHEAHRRDPHVR